MPSVGSLSVEEDRGCDPENCCPTVTQRRSDRKALGIDRVNAMFDNPDGIKMDRVLLPDPHESPKKDSDANNRNQRERKKL